MISVKLDQTINDKRVPKAVIGTYRMVQSVHVFSFPTFPVARLNMSVPVVNQAKIVVRAQAPR